MQTPFKRCFRHQTYIIMFFLFGFPLFLFHIYAKTITRLTHKFMECQRKADRRKNNDIMLTCTHAHTHKHTHSFSWAYANDAPDSWAKAAQRWLEPDKPWVAPLTHIYLHIPYAETTRGRNRATSSLLRCHGPWAQLCDICVLFSYNLIIVFTFLYAPWQEINYLMYW